LTNRFTARTGSLRTTILFAIATAMLSARALADAPLNAVYQRQVIHFTHIASSSGATAIGVDDPGFQTLLRTTGATITWKPGERYVLITTSLPMVISFALGDRRYDAGPVALQAGFAPYQRGNEAYLPFDEVLAALGLALRHDGAVAVLQPQLSALDVQQNGNRVMLIAHGGALLHPRIIRENDAAVTYAFDGVGSALSGTRQINAGGIRNVQIATSGTVRNPTTLVTVQLASGAVAEPPRQEERGVLLTFDAAVPAAPPVAQESPTPEPPPAPEASNGPAMITGVTASPTAEGVSVAIAISGSATYQWHRLREPDNRFWIDIKGAELQGPPIE
jgi:hypothetical protein